MDMLLRGHLDDVCPAHVLSTYRSNLPQRHARRDARDRAHDPDPWHAEHDRVHEDGASHPARLELQPFELAPAVDHDRAGLRRPPRLTLSGRLSARLDRKS